MCILVQNVYGGFYYGFVNYTIIKYTGPPAYYHESDNYN